MLTEWEANGYRFDHDRRPRKYSWENIDEGSALFLPHANIESEVFVGGYSVSGKEE